MSKYYWDEKIEYLANTRWLYYNDDYLEFLIKTVLKFTEPVNIVDFGCGFGYLGLKLLPILPKGSKYTGIDRGSDLINKAKDLFNELPYDTDFIEGDITKIEIVEKYDVAICHAVLLHMKNPRNVLQKMIDSVVNDGKVICFEPHWISSMSSIFLDDEKQTRITQLGNLQKLYEQYSQKNLYHGNIGIELPIIMSQLGLKYVDCRVSDKVNFLDQNMDDYSISKLYNSLKEDGIGYKPNNKEEYTTNLMNNGLSKKEAIKQFESESYFYEKLTESSWLTFAPNMKISFGTVV